MNGILDSVDIFEMNDLNFNDLDLQNAPDHQPTEGSDSDSGISVSNSHNATLLNDFCPLLEEYDGMEYLDSSLEHHLAGSSVAEMRSVDLLLTQNNLERIHKKQERMIKNRHAASLSRLRKKEYLERLEMRYEHLKRENLHLWRQNEEWRLRCVHLERCIDDLQSRLSNMSREGGDQQGVSLLPPLQLSPVNQYRGQTPRSVASADLVSTRISSSASPSVPTTPYSSSSSASLAMTSVPVTATAPRVSLSTLASSSNAGFSHTVKEFYPSLSSKSPISLFTSPVDSRLPCIRTPSPPKPTSLPLPVRKHASIGLYNRSQNHLGKVTTSPSSLYKSYTATTAAASSILVGHKISSTGGVITKRPRLVATTTTSLLAILCLFSVNTLLLPRAPWASSSETGVGQYRPGNHIGHLMSGGGAGRRVLLSLPGVDETGEGHSSKPVTSDLPVNTFDDDEDYTTIDCSKVGNQSTVGEGCQTVKDRIASRAKSSGNFSMDDPDEVLQNWIKRNRRPVNVPRSSRGFRNHRVRRTLKSKAARVAALDTGERGLQIISQLTSIKCSVVKSYQISPAQKLVPGPAIFMCTTGLVLEKRSAQPLYRYRDGGERKELPDVEALLLEAAYMIGTGGFDQEYTGRHRRNVIVNKNNTVYLLLSGVDFTVIHIPSSPPVNSTNGRQKMTFILPDNSQPAASFDGEPAG